jgi:hypothetical protein
MLTNALLNGLRKDGVRKRQTRSHGVTKAMQIGTKMWHMVWFTYRAARGQFDRNNVVAPKLTINHPLHGADPNFLKMLFFGPQTEC